MIILEAKKADSLAGMETACDEAVKQILEREYARTIEPGYEQIICYGIAFFRKSALVRKL